MVIQGGFLHQLYNDEQDMTMTILVMSIEQLNFLAIKATALDGQHRMAANVLKLRKFSNL